MKSAVLKVASVLTVVATPPPEKSFRPSYVGTKKTLYSGAALREDLLLNIQSVGDGPSLDATTELMSRISLDYNTDWSGEDIMPIDSVGWYGAGIAYELGEAALHLLVDHPADQKRQLLVQYVQSGIDLYGILQSGGGWPGDGGHGAGRKLPILLAGLMLGDQNMQAIGTTYPPDSNHFGEDCQTYYDDPSYANYYGADGFPRWGIRHCQDPHDADYNDESNDYRACCTSQSWIGQTLAARLLKLEKLWAHQAYFDYEDRWTQTENNGYWNSPWADAMWAKHRASADVCHNQVQDKCSVRCDPANNSVSGEQATDCGGTCSATCR